LATAAATRPRTYAASTGAPPVRKTRIAIAPSASYTPCPTTRFAPSYRRSHWPSPNTVAADDSCSRKIHGWRWMTPIASLRSW
jgi:hypothetical protein